MFPVRQQSQASIGGLIVDVVLMESHDMEADVSEYPIEKGANIVDHVRNRPLTLSLECVVSDTPLPAMAALRDTAENPSAAAMARLIAMRDAREPVTVVTGLSTYENMVMVSLSLPVDIETGDGLRFRASFRQIGIAENRRAVVRLPSPSVPRGSAKKNLGAKPSAEVDLDKLTKDGVGNWIDDNRSTLHKVFK